MVQAQTQDHHGDQAVQITSTYTIAHQHTVNGIVGAVQLQIAQTTLCCAAVCLPTQRTHGCDVRQTAGQHRVVCAICRHTAPTIPEPLPQHSCHNTRTDAAPSIATHTPILTLKQQKAAHRP